MIRHSRFGRNHEESLHIKLERDLINKRLLATTNNEPFQPVRLYYSIPDRSLVTRKLRAVKCMIEVPPERCWQWLFHAEAASIRFPQEVMTMCRRRSARSSSDAFAFRRMKQ
jgi:hypothetical protein